MSSDLMLETDRWSIRLIVCYVLCYCIYLEEVGWANCRVQPTGSMWLVKSVYVTGKRFRTAPVFTVPVILE